VRKRAGWVLGELELAVDGWASLKGAAIALRTVATESGEAHESAERTYQGKPKTPGHNADCARRSKSARRLELRRANYAACDLNAKGASNGELRFARPEVRAAMDLLIAHRTLQRARPYVRLMAAATSIDQSDRLAYCEERVPVIPRAFGRLCISPNTSRTGGRRDPRRPGSPRSPRGHRPVSGAALPARWLLHARQ
jgi:hypothetical protein